MLSDRTASPKGDILVVDDVPENLQLLSTLLTEQGYEVRRVINGRLALTVAHSDPPELILLDIMMPELDGYEVCQQLKASEATRDIPVIFLSALDDLFDKVKAFSVGGVDYISKPIQAQEVIARVENQLTLVRQKKRLQEQTAQLEQEIKERKRAEAALQESARKLRNYNVVLAQLARSSALHEGDLKVALQEITEASARIIEVERSSIWLYNETSTHLQCVDLFEQSCHQHSSGLELTMADYPAYFHALQQDQPIVADNVCTDRRTHEFAESYWTPLGISATLDTPIRIKGHLAGVMCLEYVGSEHHWTPEDQSFARSLADLVSLAIEARERQQAEEAVRQFEERWQLVLKGNNDGIWDWNIITGEVFFSTRWKKMLGYEDNELENNYEVWAQRIHPDDFDWVVAALNAYLERKIPNYAVEHRLGCKDGTYKWILSRGQAVWNEQGQPVRVVGSNTDISDRKQAEAALQFSEARNRAIVEAIPDLLFRLSSDGTYLDYRAPNFTNLAVPPSAFLDRTVSEVLPPDIAARFEHHIQQAVSTKQIQVFEYQLTPLHGVLSDFEARTAPVGENEVLTIVRDISDKKRSEAALRESEQRFRAIFNSSFQFTAVLQPDGMLLDVNQTALDFTQSKLSDFVGRRLWEVRCWATPNNKKTPKSNRNKNAPLLSPKQELLKAAIACAARGETARYEVDLQGAAGAVTTLDVSIKPVFDSNQNVVLLIAEGHDITERKCAEETLRQMAEREKAIATVIQRMRQSLDLDTIFTATTEELRQLIKCDRIAIYRFNPDWSGEFVAESVGREWISLVHQQHQDTTFIENTLEDSCCTVKTLSSHDAGVRDTYLQNTQGGAYRRGTNYLCVTDIYQAKLSSCYISLLERFQARAYITVPIFCGSKLWGLLATYQNSGPRQWNTAEINIMLQIGNQLGVALQQAELLEETRRQSAALEQAVYAADAANRAKSEFLASMSHELRTPLNAILGFTQVMSRDSSLSTQHQQHLGIINRAGEHLLNLINDVLEMSKIEAGRITLHEKCFDLIRLLASLEEMFRLKAESKGLELIFEIASDIPQYVKTDESKLRQVLMNLIGNAIKFTESGHVMLRVIRELQVKKLNVESSRKELKVGTLKVESSKQFYNLQPANLQPATQIDLQPATLQFQVEDTGSGIAPEEIDLLFEPFGQTEVGRKSQQGTGLGLPISRKYVELMEGTISVSSVLGKGSTFMFDIQIALADAADVEITQPQRKAIGLAPSQPDYRILVVDDRFESRLVLVTLFTSIGFSVREAENGQDAIAVWESWEPHLIFMDMQMPVMDGYEATKHIKAIEHQSWSDQNTTANESLLILTPQSKIQNQKTIVIALTASAFEDERQIVLSAGCDDFVGKPFRAEVLLNKISQYLGVVYIYEETAPQIGDGTYLRADMFTSENYQHYLSQMPAQWVVQLHNAATIGSDDIILALLAQIPQEYASIAQALTQLANNFQFGRIIELIQHNTTGIIEV